MSVKVYKRVTFRLVACCLLTSLMVAAFPGQGYGIALGQVAGRCQSALSSSSLVDECVSSDTTTRGGFAVGSSPSEGIIRNFLSKSKDATLENFHVQGWRWHTLSLVREAGRLVDLASKTNPSDAQQCESLKEATDYVIGFNLRGLHAIEADLFFPWMKQKLISVDDKDLAKAFETVMDQLEEDRKKVSKLGVSIKQSVSVACDTSKSSEARSRAIQNVVDESTQLQQKAKSMMDIENSLLVPSIAQIVPQSEQKSFNNKVLLNLGVFESRLHLVGMYEAVQESNNKLEMDLFQQAIPSIPQMMIPRWKRKLYDPKTSVFD